MSLFVLSFGVGAFLVILLVHRILWIFLDVKKEIIALALLFAGGPVTILYGSYVGEWGTPIERWASFLLTLALSAAYMQSYPIFRIRIPTFRLLMFIDQHPAGVTEAEIVKEFDCDPELFGEKIGELQRDAFIHIQGDQLRLTVIGRCLAWFFMRYRRLLGLELGGG